MSKKKSYLFFVETFLFLIWSVLGGLLNVKLRNKDSSNNNFLIIGLKHTQVCDVIFCKAFKNSFCFVSLFLLFCFDFLLLINVY